MIIKDSQFARGVVADKNGEFWDTTIPQIVFYGRSNAGKSSTVNRILGRKKLAKSSRTPGKTQEVNFYTINNGEFYVVDTPGYGYAKLPKTVRDKIRNLILWFMGTRTESRKSVMVVDAKIGLTDLDWEILERLVAADESVTILLNKSDKLKQSEIAKTLNTTRKSVPDGVDIIVFSADTGRGVDPFWAMIEKS
ncbi:MAG: ribosome biosis GTP-binding protein YsxC/EngB [Patescibacteria group bacterium]|nr:ribosome biosis GTP-binding protein YsxC/EngB [Patescibacteria group bacterium]